MKMKKTSLLVVGLSALGIMFMAASCHDSINVQDSNAEPSLPATEPSTSVNVAALLEKTSVRLFDGVKTGDIGVSFEDRVQKLTVAMSRAYGRSIQGTDEIAITTADITGILEAQLAKIEIPELINPVEEDIAAINQDFPELTEEEIIQDLETIQKIYQDEVGALALTDILRQEILPLLTKKG